MKYIKVEDIKDGMRIAKPIYSDTGILLYGRDTKINESVKENIKKLNFYGMYILEPTEPLPPVLPEEEKFEKFQTLTTYQLKKELDSFVSGGSMEIEPIVANIIRNFGGLKNKITYIQTMRSNEDFPYKHMLSVAMLCSIICGRLNMEPKEQISIISAALIHDLGKLIAPSELINKQGKLTPAELKKINEAELKGYDLVRDNYSISAGIRRYIIQQRAERTNEMAKSDNNESEQKLLLGTKIIKVADMFDTLTAMRVYKDPMSEFSAIKFFREREDQYDEKIVDALIESIHILPKGACVELTNGEKGLVLEESEYFLLRPKVLVFGSNVIHDLSQRKTYEQIQIKDILKTMDNRFVMNNS